MNISFFACFTPYLPNAVVLAKSPRCPCSTEAVGIAHKLPLWQYLRISRRDHASGWSDCERSIETTSRQQGQGSSGLTGRG